MDSSLQCIKLELDFCNLQSTTNGGGLEKQAANLLRLLVGHKARCPGVGIWINLQNVLIEAFLDVK